MDGVERPLLHAVEGLELSHSFDAGARICLTGKQQHCPAHKGGSQFADHDDLSLGWELFE